MNNLTGLANRIAVGTNMSNDGRNGRAYANASVIVACAYLARELQPVLLAIVQAITGG